MAGKVIDVFPFFAPYNEELLYLRVNLLKDHVDHFIIVESNKTHSGLPVERKFEEIARKQGLPMEKIIYIPHDIPETEDLEIRNIDRKNAGENGRNEESVLARVRERLQKDAAMAVVDQFDNDDVFIYGDMDEIINPRHVRWVANVARNNEDYILKIPLVYLQGRADLRIHHRDGKPVVWWRAMFFCTRNQLRETTFNNIRCGYIPLKVTWPAQDGKRILDMGWHFAWMGNNEQRIIKADSFAHAHDKFKWMAKGEGYNSEAYQAYVSTTQPAEGKVAPDGNEDHILKRYPIKELPDLIFETPMVKDFLLPEVKEGQDFSFNDCGCYWCQKLEWPLMYDLDGKRKWFEVPRSCSVTIKESFPNRKQILRDSEEYQEAIDNGDKPLVVFTDPIERFLSCMNVYLVPGQRYYDYGKDIFDSLGLNLDECTKEQKIDYFFRNLHKITNNHQVHHFHPQCRFVDTQSFNEFTVINKMEVSDFLKTDKHLNSTEYEIKRKDLSTTQISWIRKIYDSDYKFFKEYGDGKKKSK
jgi:hypothetical protein